ncbi:unnamed protein product [Ixodes pacificus]
MDRVCRGMREAGSGLAAGPHELEQAADSTKTYLMLEEECLERPLGPELHGVRKHAHRDGVHPEEVAHKDHPRDALVDGTHAGDGADVVGDGHQGGAGQVLARRRLPARPAVHIPKATGHRVGPQVEAGVVSAVDVPHQLVHVRAVPPLSQVDGLLKGLAAREQAAEAQEGATPQAGARDPVVLSGRVHCQDAHARANVHHQVRVWAAEVVWHLDAALHGAAVIVALTAVVRLHVVDAPDERVHLVKLVQAQPHLGAEVALKLVGPAARGTHRRGQAGNALGLGQLEEAWHLARWEADEVQRAFDAPYHHTVHLEVHVPLARLTVCCILLQVVLDLLQGLRGSRVILHRRLEVHQLHQGATNVHPEPGHSCRERDNLEPRSGSSVPGALTWLGRGRPHRGFHVPVYVRHGCTPPIRSESSPPSGC